MSYSYLAGWLQSSMKALAFDHKFIEMKNIDKRLEYIENIIKAAREEALNYSETLNYSDTEK